MQHRLPWAACAALAICAPLCVPWGHASAQSTEAPDAHHITDAAAAQATARFQRVQQRYRTAKTFRITFEQVISNTLTGSTSTARGELVSQRPNLFAITFTEPATGDQIVCDGTSVWLYLPSSVPGQVLKIPASSSGGAMSDPIGHILTAPAGQYQVRDGGRNTVADHAVRGVTLTPKSTDPLFTSATVWLDDDGTVRRIDVTEASGLTRQLTIVKQATNVSLPSAAFRFTPPPKVRVVDQRGMSGEGRGGTGQ